MMMMIIIMMMMMMIIMIGEMSNLSYHISRVRDAIFFKLKSFSFNPFLLSECYRPLNISLTSPITPIFKHLSYFNSPSHSTSLYLFLRNAYHTLFVARISHDTTEKKLRREFEQYGPVRAVKMVNDKDGKSRSAQCIMCSEMNV